MRVSSLLVVLLMLMGGLGTAQETTTYVAHYLEPFPGPQVYKDQHSGTTLYLETDGRHVAAISSDGKLLWSRDPFKDAHLPFYRTKKPQIIYIGPLSKSDHPSEGDPDEFVAITFNNSQFGLLRIMSGDFRFRGQD
jgi:hypothetical protein